MDVQVERSFTIAPSPSEPVEVPLTVFDLIAKPSHVTVLYAFSAPTPTNDALLTALTAVLPHFPLLSASIERHPVTDRPFFVTGKGGKGVLVVAATVATSLADHLPLAPSSPDLARLHVPAKEGTCHMLKVQISRFACGGVVIAPSSHHQAADGPSMRIFLQAWVDTVRDNNGVPPDDVSAPYGPRALVPRCPPRCEFEHRGAKFLLPLSPSLPSDEGSHDDEASVVRVDPSEISNTLLHYDKEFIAELKAKAHNKYSTFETLSAHVWKKITVARGLLDSATPTAIYVASTETSARGLVGGSLADAAAMVRAAARAGDEPYLQSFIDFGALHCEESLEPAVLDEDNLLSPDVDVNSWLHIGLHTLDFGSGGKLVGILPAKIQLEGEVYLIPSLRKEGGVDVLVALWEKHAKQLQSIAYAMD
ncbi:hypothetical protein QOZ80_2AG0131080 [Eleusine coracana subsp. coracana]|nr:hypothetical protein QOZ80_2AG0131080 [Eleusine coracana subsp. coracana]